MEYDKLVIFGYPRSGTKLLADAYAQNGYHNFGEFFNTYSAKLIHEKKPYAKRMSAEQQSTIHNNRNINPVVDELKHTRDVTTRMELYKRYVGVSPSIVTTWPENFFMIPGFIHHLKNHFFLCPRRKNKFEQFLSRLITYYNYNYDAEKESEPINVEMSVVESLYISFLRTEHIQNNIVTAGLGKFIDFDELITGKADLGVPYIITSEDQHTDVTQYIQNLDEVKDQIRKLQSFMVIE